MAKSGDKCPACASGRLRVVKSVPSRDLRYQYQWIGCNCCDFKPVDKVVALAENVFRRKHETGLS